MPLTIVVVVFSMLAAIALAIGRHLCKKRYEVAERQYAAIVREHQRRG